MVEEQNLGVVFWIGKKLIRDENKVTLYISYNGYTVIDMFRKYIYHSNSIQADRNSVM